MPRHTIGCFLLAMGIAFGVTTTGLAQAVSEEERQEGFIAMFNGQDFSGWQFGGGYGLPDKVPSNWKVEDGVIKLSGGGQPYLGSQWDYEDFEMRFQWRAMRERYNSGFFIRSGRKVRANQINLAKGGEGRFFGGKMKGGKSVPELQKPPMEWNEWRVRCIGDKVTFWCNDKLAWEGTEFAARRGHLGLQAEGAPLEFRNLRVKDLGYDLYHDLSAWASGGQGWKLDGDNLVPDPSEKTPLRSKKTAYVDYVLRLEWRADKAGLGSPAAIGLRGGKFDKADVVLVDTGSGGVPGYKVKPTKKLDNPRGQWNYLQIRLEQGDLTVWLNGANVVEKLSLEGNDLPARGGIALKPGGAAVRFRNIRIKPLGPAS